MSAVEQSEAYRSPCSAACGIPQPDQAEAVELAVWEEIECVFSLFVRDRLADSLNPEREPVGEIAQRLNATPDDVRSDPEWSSLGSLPKWNRG
jgi:hypothetical protein